MPWTVADVDKHNKGLSAAKKRQWVRVANSVRAKCLEEGKSESTCDAAAVRQANGVVSNSTENYYSNNKIQINFYIARTEMHNGQSHLIVPVVLMVEGVHHGNQGPLLHLAEELSKHPWAWNGSPISIGHPQEDGIDVSCNSPNILEDNLVGRVFNASYQDGRLRAEAWLDEEKLDKDLLQLLQNGRPIEVSAGMFSDEDMVQGEWNGEQYIAIARNYRPDHLALLPDSIGACSLEDGCGVRINKEGGDKNMSDVITVALRKEFTKKGFSVIQINKQGFRELMSNIQSKLDDMDDGQKMHFLTEVFDNYFIYEVQSRTGDGVVVDSGTLYRRDYSADRNGAVEFKGSATEVVRKVSYVTQEEVSTNTSNGKGGDSQMTDTDDKGKKEKECPGCPAKVDALIANEATQFEEKDREWLINLGTDMGEEVLDRFVPVVKEPDPVDAKDDKGDKTPPAPAPEMNEEAVIKMIADKFSDPDKVLALLPKETQEVMSSGLRLHREQRHALTEHIMANSDFLKEELDAKSLEELEKLASMTSVPVPEPQNYALVGAGAGQSGGVEPMLPHAVEAKKE